MFLKDYIVKIMMFCVSEEESRPLTVKEFNEFTKGIDQKLYEIDSRLDKIERDVKYLKLNQLKKRFL